MSDAESAPKAWVSAVRAGNRRHLDEAERDTDGGADDQRDEDPLVMRHLGVEERCGENGDRGCNFADQHATHRGSRRTEPLQCEHEPDHSEDVADVDEMLNGDRVHGFFALAVLNMWSIRSVIKKPPTMLLNDAATAMTSPRAESKRRVSCRPAMMMAATTTIASSAFVSDINGVCNSGETRLMSSNPKKPARMNT